MTLSLLQSRLPLKKQPLRLLSTIEKCLLVVSLSMLSGCYEDVSWIPSGFTQSGLDSNIAFKFEDQKAVARSWGYSQKVSFVSKTNCDSLFVEVALKDANGSIIGTTNDGYDKSFTKGQVITLNFMSPNRFVETSGRSINCL